MVNESTPVNINARRSHILSILADGVCFHFTDVHMDAAMVLIIYTHLAQYVLYSYGRFMHVPSSG